MGSCCVRPRVYAPQDFATQIARGAELCDILVCNYSDADRRIGRDSIRSCPKDYLRYIEYVRSTLDHLTAGAGGSRPHQPGDTGSHLVAACLGALVVEPPKRC